MSGAHRVIRWSTAVAVLGVAAVAAVASYEHAYGLVRAHGEVGWTARLVPLTVGGLIYASSMVMLDSARRKVPIPALAWWLLGLGIAATLAANVAHGLVHGPVGAVVAAWPAVALVRATRARSATRSRSRSTFTGRPLPRENGRSAWRLAYSRVACCMRRAGQSAAGANGNLRSLRLGARPLHGCCLAPASRQRARSGARWRTQVPAARSQT